MFTMKDWKSDFLKDIEPFFNINDLTTEISEDVYYNFLESMPPISIYKGFMNSEPYSHNSENKPCFLAFQKTNNKYYFIGILSQSQADILS